MTIPKKGPKIGLLKRMAPSALRTFVTFQINNLSEADDRRSAAARQSPLIDAGEQRRDWKHP